MKRMEEQDELEFFFDEEAEEESSGPHEDDASSWRQEDSATSLPRSSSRGPLAQDGPVGSDKSAATLQDVADDEPTDTFRASAARPPGGFRGMAASMPVAQHIRMGSSVPMNIPFLHSSKAQKASSRETKEEEDQPTQVQYPGTFIPPHEMSQRNGSFMFSLSGASPSAAKRDRLKARNAILKSTGFLENTGPLPTLQPALAERARFVAMAGGLSQTFKVEGVRGLA